MTKDEEIMKDAIGAWVLEQNTNSFKTRALAQGESRRTMLYGVAAVTGAVLLGTAAIVFAWNYAKPEHFVTNNNTETVVREPAPVVATPAPVAPSSSGPSWGAPNTPQITTPATTRRVTYFTTVQVNPKTTVVTGWVFPDGKAESKPQFQYCYANKNDAMNIDVNLARDGKPYTDKQNGHILTADERINLTASCRWFDGTTGV